MTNKEKAITDAIFYAHEKPETLAGLISPLVADVATSVSIVGDTVIELDTEKGSSVKYVGEVLSQFGDKMADATISLKETVTGVSIGSGTVTVAKTVTDGTTFVLVATSGALSSELTVTVSVAS